MTSFSGTADNGAEVVYTDRKRHMYWLILLSPAVAFGSMGLYFLLDKNPLVTLIPALFFYVFTPTMDAIMGEDPHNPPEEVVNAMAADNYYRFIVHALVVIAILEFLTAVDFRRNSKPTVVGRRSFDHWRGQR